MPMAITLLMMMMTMTMAIVNNAIVNDNDNDNANDGDYDNGDSDHGHQANDTEEKNLQSTPDNSNLQGKSETFELSGVRVIGSSKKIAGNKEKTVFTEQ